MKKDQIETKHQFFKNFLPAIVLSFAISFMFLIFEPISLYSGNINDFWFDLYDMLPQLVPAFFIFTVILLAFFALVYFCAIKLFKKINVYYIITSVVFCVFLITYIQGNFLANTLPGINGEVFKWRQYKVESAISVILWLIAFAGLFFAIKKFKLPKVVSFIAPITGIVFAMLTVSLVSSLVTTDALKDKFITKATFDYYNQVSNDRNFFIFLVDAVDSKSFDNLLQDDSDYQNTFKDFTYYQDTVSYYPYTRDSIPYIFSQIPNHNETSFDKYSQSAFANSSIIKTLNDDHYNMYFYDNDVIMDPGSAAIFKNISSRTKINRSNFFSEIARYDFYKYLPYPLKGKAHIENLSFQKSDLEDNKVDFDWRDKANYDIYNNEELEVVDQKVFHFIHLEGAHIWFNLDENLNPVDKTVGTYSQKQTATFKVIKAYLDRLKSANAYDNASIVIMADHGYRDGVWEYDYINSRFNPILYIKGVNENHSKMLRSDQPISFEDLGNAFDDLHKGKSSTELFQGIKAPRDRTIIYYVWNEEDHMVEEIQTGPAWDDSTIIETGNVFDLK
ncbi:MAG: hypothetical protein K6G49_01070 [Candidatus Saccharibacteria bacterium]|nr:hypothetical protein [Candidatus Saccharibacteria bacterium]